MMKIMVKTSWEILLRKGHFSYPAVKPWCDRFLPFSFPWFFLLFLCPKKSCFTGKRDRHETITTHDRRIEVSFLIDFISSHLWLDCISSQILPTAIRGGLKNNYIILGPKEYFFKQFATIIRFLLELAEVFNYKM